MGHTLKILIAEDNAADVFLIKQALKEQGLRYQAEVASDGEQALAFLHRFSAASGMMLDLVLLDLNLRTHHGTEILARIRSMPDLQQVPVVVLTSSDSPSDREQMAKLGANLYIRKPMDLAAFLGIGEQIARVLANCSSP
jgi:two-component system, chemotaxis family, response regulator Rcp1